MLDDWNKNNIYTWKLSNEKPTSWQKDDKKYSTVETSPDNQNYCSIIVGSKDINVYLLRQ